MKVFPKGQIVIPIALRKKYHIEIGDQLDVISSRDGILLKPVPKKNKKNSYQRHKNYKQKVLNYRKKHKSCMKKHKNDF